MNGLMKKKLFILSIASLCVAQPATANYTQNVKKAATVVGLGVLGGALHKGSNWLCENIFFKKEKMALFNKETDKYNKKMSDTADNLDRLPVKLAVQQLQINNKLNKVAFTNGFDAWRSGKTLWNAKSSIFDTKKWNTKAAGIATLYGTLGILNLYADQLVEKSFGRKWAALTDLIGRSVRHGILWKTFKDDKNFHRNECEAFGDILNLGLKINRAW